MIKNSNYPFSFDENKIWKEFKNGNREALAHLFKYYYNSLYQYGYKLILNKEIVKDAIQDLFLTLWIHRNSISKPNSIKSYLLFSLRRRIFRIISQEKSKHKLETEYLKESFNEFINIDDLIVKLEIDKENKSQIQNAIEQLSKRHREALYLKFYDNLTIDEISEIMNINKQSIYNLIYEALKSLKKYINSIHRIF
ncbi:MAG: RNA polymerase sigma-70 factor [Ignavibacterium sp.]